MADPTQEQLQQLEAQLKKVSDALTEYRKRVAQFSTAGTTNTTGPGSPRAAANAAKPQSQGSSKEEVDAARNEFTTASDTLLSQISGLSAGDGISKTTRSSSAADSPEPTSFSSFIQSVGESLSTAQKSLDSQARETFRAASASGGPLLPTLYRIPKLSAEVKFAFGKKTDKGLNLLFFSKKEQASEEHQQSIAFDIVATPPPPELLERLKLDVPSLQLVLAPSVREEVLDGIRGFRQLRKDLAPTKLKRLELDHLPGPDAAAATEDRLVIIQIPDAGTRRFLVFAAGNSADPDRAHEVGAWHVDLTDPENPQLEAVLRYSSEGDTGENQGFLREFILALGKRQAQFLAGLRPA